MVGAGERRTCHRFSRQSHRDKEAPALPPSPARELSQSSSPATPPIERPEEDKEPRASTWSKGRRQEVVPRLAITMELSPSLVVVAPLAPTTGGVLEARRGC
jgi:hypothetical protein